MLLPSTQLQALLPPPRSPPSNTSSKGEILTLETLTKEACFNTSDPESCFSSIQEECEGKEEDCHSRPISIVHSLVKVSMAKVQRAVEMISGVTLLSSDFREQVAINDCKELLDYSMDELGGAMLEMEKIRSGAGSAEGEGDLSAWLSAALGNQDTCLEGFEGTSGRVKDRIQGSLEQVTQLVSNVLAMFVTRTHSLPIRPVGAPGDDDDGEFPRWVSAQDRSFLRANPANMAADAVVAADGSGRYRSIVEAIHDSPDHSAKRYVIYVKEGVYDENVELNKKKMNIAVVGDGMGKTVVTGNRNFLQGWTTFRTATFAVAGRGFIARDITFRNTAGPLNHQAVALRVDSDRSAFFRCSIEGYQDTLYAHSLRQFYRDCHVHGTVDFIFGNGAVVIQNAKIFTRTPLATQKITITAQGRKKPHQSTGFSIHRSFVYARHPAYLGRPWKKYSRTVFMQTFLSGQVRPQGWLPWAGDFALNTLYYGEYQNYGPGAGLGGRVRWPGYHPNMPTSQANSFTVRRFIDGEAWLPATGVTFTSGLGSRP